MIAIFESILHMSAVGSIVIFTVVIVRFFLKNAPKLYSYLLWAIVLVRLLCPFTIESALSTIPRDISSNTVLQEQVPDYIWPSQKLYSHESGFDTAVDAGAEIYFTDTGDSYVSVSLVGPIPSPELRVDLMTLLSILWLCGVAIMTAWSIVGYVRLKMWLRGATACDKGVYLSYKVDSPFVLGLFRPKIYLPASLSPEEWDYIVLHERCHIRRGDHITRVLAFAALAIHWFNPLVWLAFILSGRDMEMSCDESVVRSMGPEVRKSYSASLLSLATGRPMLSGMPLAFGEGDPKGRIRNLAKWRKPTLAMIIAAVLVCVVAAVCLLTDPLEQQPQIRVNGRVYTYTGSEENPADTIWELGSLEGIVHHSDEEPEEDFHGTNLDEKYAGQPLYASLDGRIYLFDENGYFLPFELPKGDIVSGPTEVARGDFNRDGQSDFITVTDYSNSVEIILADSISAKTLWADTASLVEGQQKCFIARKDDDGDSIIRYTFHEEGYCNYIRFFIGGDGELVVEKGRSPVDHLLEAGFTDPEAISASLPENSTFLFSTYGGSAVIGPIKRAGSEAETGSEQEQRCLAAIKKVLSTESARVSKMYGLGIITNRATLFYSGTDWLLTDAGQGYSQSHLVVDGEGYAYEQSGSDGVWYPLEKLPAMPNLFGNMNYERQYTGREELENGYALCFIIDPVEAGLPNGNEAAGETTERFLFNSNGEFYCLSRRMPLGVDTAGEEYIYMEELSVDYFSAKDLDEAIKEEYEKCINEIARREAAITEHAVYDDGSDVIAVPYGESIVIDLDGDGVEEVLRIKASNIYGVDSITINGDEYLDQLESYLGTDLNPEPDQFPNYYIVRTYKGDYSPKICVFDNGPSGDPKTHFFTFNHNSSLQYHGYVPCHVSNLSFDGNHHMTGPARLSVFQTWYAEHTWYLPSNGTKVREMERDFYYVDDFEFVFYPIDGVYYPPSKYTPLLCDVCAYEDMDISAEPLILKEGTELSILGTDDKEWLLVADKAGREYYLHLCGINACSIHTPEGEVMGNAVFNGLNYAD